MQASQNKTFKAFQPTPEEINSFLLASPVTTTLYTQSHLPSVRGEYQVSGSQPLHDQGLRKMPCHIIRTVFLQVSASESSGKLV